MNRNLSRGLKQKTTALKRLCARDPRVLGVFLFGSQADGTASPRSDIDLAVLFERDLDLREELTFESAVSLALGTDDLDVVNLNRANLLLRFRAIAGKLLYARDETRVADFTEDTLIAYRDFEPRAQAALRDYLVTL
jgi:predicted nucleotidyltransferase